MVNQIKKYIRFRTRKYQYIVNKGLKRWYQNFWLLDLFPKYKFHTVTINLVVTVTVMQRTEMINNSAKVNKAKNHCSPKIMEHIKDHYTWCWKSRSWQGDRKKCSRVKLVNGNPTPSWYLDLERHTTCTYSIF